jgi:hypothetical protein
MFGKQDSTSNFPLSAGLDLPTIWSSRGLTSLENLSCQIHQFGESGLTNSPVWRIGQDKLPTLGKPSLEINQFGD